MSGTIGSPAVCGIPCHERVERVPGGRNLNQRRQSTQGQERVRERTLVERRPYPLATVAMFSLQREDACARLKVWKAAGDLEGGS